MSNHLKALIYNSVDPNSINHLEKDSQFILIFHKYNLKSAYSLIIER